MDISVVWIRGPKGILVWNPQERRDRGRPRTIWKNGVSIIMKKRRNIDKSNVSILDDGN